MSAPAGWYPDPSDPSRTRWWDGARWAAPVAPVAPVAYSPAPSVAAPAKVAVDTNTIWVWLAIVMSVLPLATVFLVDWDGYLAVISRVGSGSAPTAELSQWEGHVFAISSLSWIALAAFIVFSWLDWRELRKRGVSAPFHWAWSFFSLLNGGTAVYMIGRAVVLNRRTVSGGWAPFWVWLGVTVIGLIVGVVWMIGFISQLLTAVGGMSV